MARRWFQIHLSTALVLMLVAAGLLWVNLEHHSYPSEPGVVIQWGWPWIFYSSPIYLDSEPIPGFEGYLFVWQPLLRNICVALAILTATAVLCESLARRKQNAR